jgi:hypothetical protein
VKRAALIAACALAAAALGVPSAGSGPNRVQVVALEYSLQVSHDPSKRGRTIIEVVNNGQDPHDLHIQKVGAKKEKKATGVIVSRQRAELTVPLEPGTWHLWCSLTDHASRGMSIYITVTSTGS